MKTDSKDWTHTIHDGEIFLRYKGADAGVLLPNPGFTNWHVNAVLATLNAYFPTEPGTREPYPQPPASHKALKAALDMLHELHHDHADNWPEHQLDRLNDVGEMIRAVLATIYSEAGK